MAPFSGQRARGLRNCTGLSRQALATRVGVSTESVKGWETGTFAPSPQSLTALADALHVTPADFEQVHDDPVQDYVSAVLHDRPPLPPEDLEIAARVLGRIRARRLSGAEPAA